MSNHGIQPTASLHFVQIKAGALTSERIAAARGRERPVVTVNYSRHIRGAVTAVVRR